MSSDQLSQRLLISAVQDEAPLLEIFSHELSGVAPSSFHNNREIRKNKKPELMNKANTILIDILMESAFHVTDGCTCLYCFYWAKVGNIKYLYSSFKQTLLNECGTNINQISILVKKYTVESAKVQKKRRKKNLALVEMEVYWHLPVPQKNKKSLGQQQQQAAVDLFVCLEALN